MPPAVALVSGDQQVGAAGTALPQPLVVRVTAADLLGVKGVPVAFSATATGGVTPSRVFTANAGSWDITALVTATVTVDTVDCTGVGATCSEPRNPAYNHAGTLVAVPHRFSNNLLLLDPALPDFVAEVQDTSFHEPYAAIFTANDQEVWVANKFGGGSIEGTVSVVDVTSRTVVAVVRDTTFGSPEGIVISGSRAYVANRGKNTITVVDVPTRAVVARIDLGVSNTPRHLVATPDGLLVYASTSTSSVARIQTSDNSVTIIPTVGFGSSRNLAVRPDGAFVYAAMQNSEVAVVDVSTGGVTTMTFGGAFSLYGVAILADGSLGFASDESGNLIYAFDPATNTPVTPAGYPVPTGSSPRGITAY